MPIATLSMPEDTSLRSENRDFLSDLRRNIASLERGNRGTLGVVGFGLPEIDVEAQALGVSPNTVRWDAPLPPVEFP